MGKLETQTKITEIQTKISVLFLFGFPYFFIWISGTRQKKNKKVFVWISGIFVWIS
jgi:preprotein translocase subunit YajC